jgi:hypothetical protein
MIFIIYCEKYADRTRNIQDVSETRVLILTSGRTRQFMKLFSIILYKISKNFPRFFASQFLPNESFVCLFFCNHENFNFNYIFNFFYKSFRPYHRRVFYYLKSFYFIYILTANLFQILNQFVTLFRKKFK